MKYFNVKNKFGFITENNSGKEYYTHSKYIVHPIKEGDFVIFEIGECTKGSVANQVRKTNEA